MRYDNKNMIDFKEVVLIQNRKWTSYLPPLKNASIIDNLEMMNNCPVQDMQTIFNSPLQNCKRGAVVLIVLKI